MEYGTNKHPPFRDDPPLLVGDLPAEYIPSYVASPPTGGPASRDGTNTSGKRLLVVGDVHGHLDALKALLRKVGFDNTNGDHLILVGDLVTKGPDSKGVVRFAMELGASAIRGNQEDKVLAAAREIHRRSGEDSPGAGDDDANNGAETASGTDRHARAIARSLSRAQLEWLRTRPIILRIGNIPGAASPPWNASTLAVVHGGLVPGPPLEEQDPWAVMNMRSLVYPGTKQPATDGVDARPPHAVAVPISGREGEPWSHAWNRHQNHLPPSAPHTLAIYGHDARKGLQASPKVDISPYRSSPASLLEDEEAEDGEEGGSDDDETADTSNNNNNNNNKKKKKDRKDRKHNKKKKDKKKGKEQGLRYAFGLDSGCGHGKQLTGLVIEATAEGVRGWVAQVECAG
ncbi:Metallo-dependent phosphatase [Trichocladium antarcticum]|uniref:Metallo-dependent phosphatase n=1 Tax=Trichocladium antarcticum TaxID=1450529 RepID=A0AAN6USJ3_9PEZI|nr:Metallo-dependent phosphatase [Trichocladium antarcticum]